MGEMDSIEKMVVAILMGLLPALIAQAKGRSFVWWWIYGALLFLVALPHAGIIKSNQAAKERRLLAEQLRKNLVSRNG
jgi:hypothetical protein